jgi:hypothetical protein
MIEPKSIWRFLTFGDSIPVPAQLCFLFFSFLLLYTDPVCFTDESYRYEPTNCYLFFFRFEALYRERSGGIGVRLEMMRGRDRINE